MLHNLSESSAFRCVCLIALATILLILLLTSGQRIVQGEPLAKNPRFSSASSRETQIGRPLDSDHSLHRTPDRMTHSS